MKNITVEERLADIIEEEVLRAIHENLFKSVASNAKSLLGALALTAGLSGMPSIASAKPPATRHQAQPESLEVAKMLAGKINAGKHKDKFGLDIVAHPSDPKIQKLGKLTAQLYNEWVQNEQAVEKYVETVYQILKVGLQRRGAPAAIYDYVSEILIKKLKEKKKQKSIVISKHEFRNDPLLIQQAFLSVHMGRSSLKKNLNKLVSTLKYGVKGGSISKKEAKDILKALKLPPSKGLEIVNRILNLN